MKHFFSIIAFLIICNIAFAQHQLRVKAGAIATYTAVAEYKRPGNFGYRLDTVSLDQQVAGPLASFEADVSLGKGIYLVTGFGYNRKGLAGIHYTDAVSGSETVREARQNYLGVNIQIKYHYRFRESRFGLYLATGPKIDFAIGEPNYAEFSLALGSEYFHAFGHFNTIEFLWYTNPGVSMVIGPGELLLELFLMNGLSDVITDGYIIGKTTSAGLVVGYSIPLNK